MTPAWKAERRKWGEEEKDLSPFGERGCFAAGAVGTEVQFSGGTDPTAPAPDRLPDDPGHPDPRKHRPHHWQHRPDY